ncbi:penicillin-binding transpeptidase domain-containing protein, partial [Bacillus sp. HC-Mk]
PLFRPPSDVAGKTGITGFPNEQERMINHSLFIAYAPTEDPQIAISVVIPGSNSEKNIARHSKSSSGNDLNFLKWV